jgi:hypothetical protein
LGISKGYADTKGNIMEDMKRENSLDTLDISSRNLWE